MTDAEQEQLYRRLALCAHYNFTEGLRTAACILSDMAAKADERTTPGAVLSDAIAMLRAKVREQEETRGIEP